MIENESCPLVKLECINGKYYCYDTNTNMILQITKELYQELIIMQNEGITKYEASLNVNESKKTILLLRKKGFFQGNKIAGINHPLTNYIEVLLHRAVNQLVLEVSEACNFRCRYCHQHSNDKFKSILMKYETARKGVDFLFENSKDETSVSITFYGGEPLINFETIRKTVEYVSEKFEIKDVDYNMTTNASLLNDEIIDFLIKNNFSLLISLDGDRCIQNYHRKFSKDGSDTFDVVWKNVCKIKEKNKTYFQQRVRFNAVLLPDDTPDDTYNFFTDNDIPLNRVNVTIADMTAIDYECNGAFYPLDCADEREETKEFDDFKNKLSSKANIPAEWHHSGPCVAGVRKLFISTDGTFFPCEKLDKASEASIGSLENGFNVEQVKKIMNVGRLSEDECKDCWAMRFCSLCVKQCITDNKICKETKLLFCGKERERIESFLRKYIETEANLNG